MFIQTETTSDPATLRFLPGRSVLDADAVSFDDSEAAARSPLAARLMQIEAVTGVSLGRDFIAVVKTGEGDWQLLKPAIFGIIMEHFLANRPVLLDAAAPLAAPENVGIVSEIEALLASRIRPSIQSEGGDIDLIDYADGVATLVLTDRGFATPVFALRVRVENTLRYYIPEITSVAFEQPGAAAAAAELDLDDPETASVYALLEERVNPAVAAHGGHISLIEVKDHTAYLRLEGGCQGCGMADVTLKQGVETMILEEVPSIVAVLDSTDHAHGDNPYFQPDKSGMSPF